MSQVILGGLLLFYKNSLLFTFFWWGGAKYCQDKPLVFSTLYFYRSNPWESFLKMSGMMKSWGSRKNFGVGIKISLILSLPLASCVMLDKSFNLCRPYYVHEDNEFFWRFHNSCLHIKGSERS